MTAAKEVMRKCSARSLYVCFEWIAHPRARTSGPLRRLLSPAPTRRAGCAPRYPLPTPALRHPPPYARVALCTGDGSFVASFPILESPSSSPQRRLLLRKMLPREARERPFCAFRRSPQETHTGVHANALQLRFPKKRIKRKLCSSPGLRHVPIRWGWPCPLRTLPVRHAKAERTHAYDALSAAQPECAFSISYSSPSSTPWVSSTHTHTHDRGTLTQRRTSLLPPTPDQPPQPPSASPQADPSLPPPCSLYIHQTCIDPAKLQAQEWPDPHHHSALRDPQLAPPPEAALFFL